MKHSYIKKIFFLKVFFDLFVVNGAFGSIDNTTNDMALMQACSAMAGSIKDLGNAVSSNALIITTAATTLDKETEVISIVVTKPRTSAVVVSAANAALNAVGAASSALVNNSNASSVIIHASDSQLLDFFVRGANSTAKILGT